MAQNNFLGFSSWDLRQAIEEGPKRKRKRCETVPKVNETVSSEQRALNPDDPEFDESEYAEACGTCKTSNSYKTRYMVKCHGCGYWHHYSCVNLTHNQAIAIEVWKCPACLRAQGLYRHPRSPQGPPVQVPEDMPATLAHLKQTVRIFKWIPKPVRATLAGILADKIDDALANPSAETWWSLLTWIGVTASVQMVSLYFPSPTGNTCAGMQQFLTLSVRQPLMSS